MASGGFNSPGAYSPHCPCMFSVAVALLREKGGILLVPCFQPELRICEKHWSYPSCGRLKLGLRTNGRLKPGLRTNGRLKPELRTRGWRKGKSRAGERPEGVAWKRVASGWHQHGLNTWFCTLTRSGGLRGCSLFPRAAVAVGPFGNYSNSTDQQENR